MSERATITCVLRPGFQWAIQHADGSLVGSFATLSAAMDAAGLRSEPAPTVWNDNLNTEIPSQ